MPVFDRIDPTKLDRRELHLWLLAVTVILILTAGLALLMYPTVFVSPVILSGLTLRKTFFGFCALSVLLVGYLIDRQIVIRQLRQSLVEEHNLILRIRREASTDLVASLPGLDHFRDRLIMEHRRATAIKQPLSVVAVRLMPARDLADTSEVPIAFGDAAKAMARKLRRGDSLYRFGPGLFPLVLPGVDTEGAYRLADRLAEGVRDASGASNRLSFDVCVVNYPDHAAAAWELEEAVRSFLTSGVVAGSQVR
jgi:GGDEF domain-containing protein